MMRIWAFVVDLVYVLDLRTRESVETRDPRPGLAGLVSQGEVVQA